MRLEPHPFSLRQLQYVVAVADLLSFGKAATRCRVAQPSLSAQVAAVEEGLGVVIFERSGRRVLVTPAGEAVVARAREVLRSADDLFRTAESTRDPFSGTLRMGVIPTVSPYLLPAVAPAVRAAWPRLRSLWVEDKTENLVAALADGSMDAAFLALEARIGVLDHALVARDPFVLALPPEHPLAADERPVSLDVLADEPLLLLEEGHCLRDQAWAACAAVGARESEFRATSLSTLTQMVAAGLGVTLLPQIALPVESARAPLRVRSFRAPAPERTIVLAWRPGSPMANSFLEIAGVAAKAMSARAGLAVPA